MMILKKNIACNNRARYSQFLQLKTHKSYFITWSKQNIRALHQQLSLSNPISAKGRSWSRQQRDRSALPTLRRLRTRKRSVVPCSFTPRSKLLIIILYSLINHGVRPGVPPPTPLHPLSRLWRISVQFSPGVIIYKEIIRFFWVGGWHWRDLGCLMLYSCSICWVAL